MELGIAALVVLGVIYFLFVKGFLWKLLLGVFGWFGMYWYLSEIKECRAHPFNNDTFTWAAVIPTIIILFAMATTKSE